MIPLLGHAAEQTLVLVTNVHNEIAPLEFNDLRRIYLGLAPKDTDITLTPVGNKSEALLYEVFLQKIVHMSSRSYERHLLTKVVRGGSQRMQISTDADSLNDALRNNKNAISFMWENDAKTNPDITIVQKIWQGSTR
jgi:hypothetical protein